MSDVSLDLLKTFLTFAESESMNETAQKLGISQPAVTFQLKKLEDELPINPFSIRGNRKVLNNFGRALYSALADKFEDVELSLTKVKNLYASPENCIYRIGGRKEVLSRILPRLKILGTLEVLSLNDEEIVHGLVQQKIDIGITFQEIDRTDLMQKRLFTDYAKFCIHPKLLGGKRLTPSLIRNLEFLSSTPAIVYNNRFPYIAEWIKECGGRTSDLKVRCLYEDWNDIMKLVENAEGYSLIPSEIAGESRNIVTREIPTEVIPRKTFSAYFHKDLKGMGVIGTMFADF